MPRNSLRRAQQLMQQGMERILTHPLQLARAEGSEAGVGCLRAADMHSWEALSPSQAAHVHRIMCICIHSSLRAVSGILACSLISMHEWACTDFYVCSAGGARSSARKQPSKARSRGKRPKEVRPLLSGCCEHSTHQTVPKLPWDRTHSQQPSLAAAFCHPIAGLCNAAGRHIIRW